MSKVVIVLLIILLVVIIGCQENVVEDDSSEDEQIISGECVTDNDCARAGCSSQLCVPKDKAKGMRTTCEFRAEYECLRLTSCSCIEGKCGWEENEEYNQCLEEKKGQEDIIIA